MDFAWTDEQLAIKDAVVRFAKSELSDGVLGRDRGGEFPAELWRKCAKFGILGLSVPAAYRDESSLGETDILTAMLAMEGLGYACPDNGLNFGLNVQAWTVQLPIVNHGSEAQKRKYLPAMSRGDLIGAHALTEADSGSDVYALKTQARKCDGGYVLNGTKRLITLAPVADVALVFVTIDPALGKWGVTAFLVDRSSPGYTAGETVEKMGLRTIPMGEITFTDCFVPEENRLGPEGAGVSISNHSLEFERCSILAGQVGAMQRQLETAVAYAKARKQFGQPIGKFQSVSNRIAEMKLRLEASRLLLYHTAWLKQQGKPAMMEAALCKLYLAEAFVESSMDAIRTHGGNGYLTGSEVERDLRDAVGGTLYAGTSDIQRNIVAKLLGL